MNMNLLFLVYVNDYKGDDDESAEDSGDLSPDFLFLSSDEEYLNDQNEMIIADEQINWWRQRRTAVSRRDRTFKHQV